MELDRRRILIAEDDPEFAGLMTVYLGAAFPRGEIDSVRTAEACFKALEQSAYDVVLLDLQLPDQSGMEVAALVRSDFASPPPLVVLTGTGTAADWLVLSRLGVKAFLLKPIRPDALAATLRRVLRSADKEAAAAAR